MLGRNDLITALIKTNSLFARKENNRLTTVRMKTTVRMETIVRIETHVGMEMSTAIRKLCQDACQRMMLHPYITASRTSSNMVSMVRIQVFSIMHS